MNLKFVKLIKRYNYEKGERMKNIVEHIQGLFTLPILTTFILIGLFLLLVDMPKLKKQKYNKESVIAKILGFVYILGSIALFIVMKII